MAATSVDPSGEGARTHRSSCSSLPPPTSPTRPRQSASMRIFFCSSNCPSRASLARLDSSGSGVRTGEPAADSDSAAAPGTDRRPDRKQRLRIRPTHVNQPAAKQNDQPTDTQEGGAISGGDTWRPRFNSPGIVLGWMRATLTGSHHPVSDNRQDRRARHGIRYTGSRNALLCPSR